MALGWLSALKVVPWSDVISNAPLVADGAKKLWGAVAKKAGVASGDAAADKPTAADATGLDGLNQRISQLSTTLYELQSQLATSSELISTLAEQNTQLIAQMDKLQRRMRWQTYGWLALAACGALALVWLSYHP
jgi:hypothetical protein